jgi:hypothetical protein
MSVVGRHGHVQGGCGGDGGLLGEPPGGILGKYIFMKKICKKKLSIFFKFSLWDKHWIGIKMIWVHLFHMTPRVKLAES